MTSTAGPPSRLSPGSALAARPGLKVLFITGHAEPAVARALKPGMHVITKPFALDTVATRIRQILAIS